MRFRVLIRCSGLLKRIESPDPDPRIRILKPISTSRCADQHVSMRSSGLSMRFKALICIETCSSASRPRGASEQLNR
jgi:hypothetical protein